ALAPHAHRLVGIGGGPGVRDHPRRPAPACEPPGDPVAELQLLNRVVAHRAFAVADRLSRHAGGPFRSCSRRNRSSSAAIDSPEAGSTTSRKLSSAAASSRATYSVSSSLSWISLATLSSHSSTARSSDVVSTGSSRRAA